MISGKSVEHFIQTEMGIGQATWLLTAERVVVGSAECHALVLKSCCWKWLVDYVVVSSLYLSTLLLMLVGVGGT